MALPVPASPTRKPRFYCVTAVARMLAVSEVTLYRAIRGGEFPAIKVRGRYVIPASALDAMEQAAIDTGQLVDSADWSRGGVA